MFYGFNGCNTWSLDVSSNIFGVGLIKNLCLTFPHGFVASVQTSGRSNPNTNSYTLIKTCSIPVFVQRESVLMWCSLIDKPIIP